MKKIIIPILAAALMTACGNVEENADGGKSIAEESTSVTTNTPAETTTAAETTKPDESSEAAETSAAESIAEEKDNKSDTAKDTDSYGSYEDAIRAYIDTMNNGSYEDYLRLMYPEKAVTPLLSLYILGKAAEELNADHAKYELTDIVEESVLSDQDLDNYALMFDQISALSDVLAEHEGNLDELTDEEQKEMTNRFMEISRIDKGDVNRVYKALKGYDVTVHYLKNGEPEEDYFFVCLIDGEGWKINNTMRKYVKKSRAAAANMAAKSMHVAYMTAICEYEPAGSLYDALFIGSDDSMTYNVPEYIDVKELKKKAEDYYPEAADYDYFAVLQDGSCAYLVVRKKGSSGEVGIYPDMSVPVSSNGKTIQTEIMDRTKEYTFEDLYDMAKGLIAK